MGETALTNGILFDIQGFSVHDGPGCRTLIFLKGCSLHCAWCSNPEGIAPLPELLYQPAHCTFDGLCTEACPSKAITISRPTSMEAPASPELLIDRVACTTCPTFACATACCTGAIRKAGYTLSVDALYERICRDRQYWGPGGGITLTGGEPFLQPLFVSEFLRRCYNAYIHTAAETCGNVSYDAIARSLPFLDWLFFDLKSMNPAEHLAMTGASNSLILKNAQRLALEFPGRLIFRLPLIPGYNDQETQIRSLIRFISATGKHEINVLPAHHLGREKYKLLGKKYFTENFSPPPGNKLKEVCHLFENEGIKCYLGSDTPF